MLDFLPKTTLLVLLLLVSLTFSAAGGQTENRDVRKRVTQVMEQEGYLGQFANGQHLQRAISAYLWDQRLWLQRVDFSRAAEVDVLVCLLIKRGYAGFDDCAENRNFMLRCQDYLRQ